jgi:predicted ATPase
VRVLKVLAVEGYRSLRRVVLPLDSLTVVTGPNGSGKSSVYRAMRLLADTARGGAVAALAREGGLPSALWAGPETVSRSVREGLHPVQGTVRDKPVSVRLGYAGDEFGYSIEFGLPARREPATMFDRDPEIKCEAIWTGPVARPATLLTQRNNSLVRVRDEAGDWVAIAQPLRTGDSMLSELADPRSAPEVLAVREQTRSWRFYDGFRTDHDAPARTARVGTFTSVLDHDGSDLPAALQTLRELGLSDTLDDAVERAFPGSRVEIVGSEGLFQLHLHQHGLLRPLAAAELSDGTLRYLLWAAALLTPRPPALFVLNEPETSLHPDLLRPLAHLIATASARSQVLAVTHSRALLDAIDATGSVRRIELTKDHGETHIAGQNRGDEPNWHWPSR